MTEQEKEKLWAKAEKIMREALAGKPTSKKRFIWARDWLGGLRVYELVQEDNALKAAKLRESGA